MLNIKDMPEAIKALPRFERDFIKQLTRDGLFENWEQAISAADNARSDAEFDRYIELVSSNDNPDNFDY